MTKTDAWTEATISEDAADNGEPQLEPAGTVQLLFGCEAVAHGDSSWLYCSHVAPF